MSTGRFYVVFQGRRRGVYYVALLISQSYRYVYHEQMLCWDILYVKNKLYASVLLCFFLLIYVYVFPYFIYMVFVFCGNDEGLPRNGQWLGDKSWIVYLLFFFCSRDAPLMLHLYVLSLHFNIFVWRFYLNHYYVIFDHVGSPLYGRILILTLTLHVLGTTFLLLAAPSNLSLICSWFISHITFFKIIVPHMYQVTKEVPSTIIVCAISFLCADALWGDVCLITYFFFSFGYRIIHGLIG